jgi:hypothetical protein
LGITLSKQFCHYIPLREPKFGVEREKERNEKRDYAIQFQIS